MIINKKQLFFLLSAHPSDLDLWLSNECKLQRLFFLLFGMESITIFNRELEKNNKGAT
jgi:hypothetical protein